MEEEFVEKSVRTRLILSGITELEEHGLSDFSLRRAALGAQVSCAAPYRHFKDKDEYIRQIIAYVASKWSLLSMEIGRLFESEPARLAIEICMASLRFRIANPNFRAVFTLAAEGGAGNALDAEIISSVNKYADSVGLDEEAREIKVYTVRALIAGSLTLLGDGDAEKLLHLARKRLEQEFSERRI